MDYLALAQFLFPDVTETPEDMEARYPRANCPKGPSSRALPPVRRGLFILGTSCRASLRSA